MSDTFKTDEFSKKFRRGEGHFQSKNLYCRFLSLYFGHEFRKKLQYDFLKMGGEESKAVWNFSENSSVLDEVGFP